MATRSGQRTRWRTVLVTAVIAAGTVTACSSTSNDGSGGSSGDYKLMVIGPFTASAALPTPFPEIATGAKAAAKVLNDAGGVHGHKIQIVECDTKADPNAGTKCAEQAVAQHIVAVAGAFDLKGDYVSVLERAGIPDLAPFARNAELGSPIAYPVNGGTVTLLAGEVSLLATRGVRNGVFVAAGDSAQGAGLEALWQPVLKNFPGLAMKLITVPPDATDLSATGQAAGKSDGIGVGLQAAQIVPFLTALHQSGRAPKAVTSDTNSVDSSVVRSLGQTVEGIYAPTNYLPPTDVGNPAVAAYDQAMDAIDPKAPKNDFSMAGYLGVKLFDKAASGVGDVTSKTIIDALNKASSIDLGLVPPISFQKSATVIKGVTRLFNTAVVYTQLRGGKFVAVDGTFVDAYTGKPVG